MSRTTLSSSTTRTVPAPTAGVAAIVGSSVVTAASTLGKWSLNDEPIPGYE